ncbi:dynactin 4, partial [Lecanoromycetidae sp. Uapishka_2]
MSFPYTFISCPCNDISASINGSKEGQTDVDEEQERTFDPSLQDIRRDIAKLKIGGQFKNAGPKTSESNSPLEAVPDDEPDSVFTTLRSFYNAQLSTSNNTDPLLTPSGGFNYSSPSSLARIMSLYTGRGAFGKKEQAKSLPMRESVDVSEGLRVIDPAPDMAIIEKIRTEGWTSTASTTQKISQRHPQKLLALNYIPTITLKPLQPAPSTNFPLIALNALPALRASQFLLTLKNPLFDPVRVTLATPTHTPGRYGHKVTVLCPQFDIGPNVDQWDEALGGDSKDRRSSKMLNLSKVEYAGGEGGKVAEAGKVWEKGRNWTTVVVETVCAAVDEEKDGLWAEDEDVLEIPVFLRMEWEEYLEKEGGAAVKATEKEKREKKELAFWVVVGVGRVGKLEKQME